MRSILFLLSAHVALGESSECQAEEIAMLQHRRPSVRLAPAEKTTPQALLEKMRGVASSLTEGSDATMTPDEVRDAVQTAHDLLEDLSPTIRQEVVNAQQALNHAHAAVQVCHAADQAQLRADLHAAAEQYAAAVESCEATLETRREEERVACERAEDCLCDEARVRSTDQEALCASRTETYEVAWCEHHNVCTIFRNCHEDEAEVYTALRTDVEAEMATLVTEYITVEQSSCLTNLIVAAMTPPLTPITQDALIACNDVDVSALSITYPDMPAQPTQCPVPAVGAPECAAWELITHHEVSAGYFPNSARAPSFTHNADDPSASLFMNVGQLTSDDYFTDGKYQFRLVYGNVAQAAESCNDGPALSGDTQEFEWTQTNWITESTSGTVEAMSPADLAASPNNDGCVFNGLAVSGTTHTVFDGSPNHGNWFHSVGSNIPWHGGIPAFKGGDAQSVSLYVRKAGYSHHEAHNDAHFEETPEADCDLAAYWEYGNCGCGGNDQNTNWCGGTGTGDCPDTVETSVCPAGTAYLAEWHPKPYNDAGHAGRGNAGHLVRDGCEYIWHAQYACQEPEFECSLSAYWEYGDGGCGGNDQNTNWCGGTATGDCPDSIETSVCPSGSAYLAVFHSKPYDSSGHQGQGTAGHYHRDGVEYIWHAQYACNQD